MAMIAGFATLVLHMQPIPAVTVDVSDAALAARLSDFSGTTAQINGIRLHYVIGGKGPCWCVVAPPRYIWR